MKTRLAAIVACAALAMVAPAQASPVRCQVVKDPAGDAVHHLGSTGVSTPNNPAVDELSADVGIGSKTLVFVIRVAGLGEVLDQGPQTYMWQMYFELRGKSFVTNATRAPDGSRFQVSGDLSEVQGTVAGATTPTAFVTGSFDPAKNEIRVVVPRKYLPHVSANKDALTKLTADSYDGVGLMAASGAKSGFQMDATARPGARLPMNSRTCVQAS